MNSNCCGGPLGVPEFSSMIKCKILNVEQRNKQQVLTLFCSIYLYLNHEVQFRS